MKDTMILHIDMDEVLVASYTSLLRMKGLDNPYDDPANHGIYSVHKLVGQTHDQFWGTITEDNWANMDKLPMADRLIQFAEGLEQDGVCKWRFLTAPILNRDCYAGKFRWIETHYPQHIHRLTIGKDKQDLIGPNDFLIDDSPANWEKMGKVGKQDNMYHFPSIGNVHHKKLPTTEEHFKLIEAEISLKMLQLYLSNVGANVNIK